VGEGVYPDVEAELFVHDACNRGPADVNDPAREIDLLDLGETVEPLGRGLSRARTADVPRYVELLGHVCAQLGWDADALRGHRTRIAFPVYGSQVSLAFRAPEGA
jgi:hypothetical protein